MPSKLVRNLLIDCEDCLYVKRAIRYHLEALRKVRRRFKIENAASRVIDTEIETYDRLWFLFDDPLYEDYSNNRSQELNG